VPLAVALAICLFARRSLQHDQQLRAAGAFAVALGFGLAWLALPWASYAVERAWQWLPYLAVAAAGIGVFAGAAPRASARASVGLAALAAWLVVPDYPAVASAQPAWVAAVAVAIVLAWSVLEHAAERSDPRGVSLVLAIWVLASAALLERCGIMKFAQLAGVAAACAAPVLVCLRRPPALAGAVAPLAVVVPGLVLSGRFETFAEVPEWSFWCVLAIPLAVVVSVRWWTPAVAAATLAAIGVGGAAAATL